MTKEFAEQILLEKGGKKVIIIPDGVQELDEECFMDMSIQEVRVPKSVTAINKNAFSSCKSIS